MTASELLGKCIWKAAESWGAYSYIQIHVFENLGPLWLYVPDGREPLPTQVSVNKVFSWDSLLKRICQFNFLPFQGTDMSWLFKKYHTFQGRTEEADNHIR